MTLNSIDKLTKHRFIAVVGSRKNLSKGLFDNFKMDNKIQLSAKCKDLFVEFTNQFNLLFDTNFDVCDVAGDSLFVYKALASLKKKGDVLLIHLTDVECIQNTSRNENFINMLLYSCRPYPNLNIRNYVMISGSSDCLTLCSKYTELVNYINTNVVLDI